MERGATSGREAVTDDFDRMSLVDHMDELRRRIVRSIIAVGVAFLALVGRRRISR